MENNRTHNSIQMYIAERDKPLSEEEQKILIEGYLLGHKNMLGRTTKILEIITEVHKKEEFQHLKKEDVSTTTLLEVLQEEQRITRECMEIEEKYENILG